MAQEIFWRAKRQMGLIFIKTGEHEKAKEMLTAALNIVESMRASLAVEKLKAGFMVTKQDIYKDMIHLLIQMGEIKSAFDLCERSRSRNFIDMLGNKRITFQEKASQELLREEQRIKNTIYRAASLKRAGVNVAHWTAALEQAKSEYEELLVKMERKKIFIKSKLPILS